MRTQTFTLVSVLVSGLCAVATAQDPKKTKGGGAPVTVHLIDTNGKDAGTATLTPSAQGLSIKFDLKDLPPGAHAVTLHQVGKCDPPDFKSAGQKLSAKTMMVTADQSGMAKQMVMEPNANLEHNKPNSLVDTNGTAIIVHSVSAQDPEAGTPIACGMILSTDVK